MRPLIVVLMVIAAWQIVDGATAEQPPSEYLVAVSVRVPPSTSAAAPAPTRLSACDGVERLVLLSTGPRLEPGRQWVYGDRGAEPGQSLHPGCGLPSPVVVP